MYSCRCSWLVEGIKWKSLVAHASLAMSRQRDSGSGAAGFAAKSLWLVLVLCFRNSFVLTVDMKLGISERVAVPRASFSGGSDEDPRCPWHRSAPLVRFGSDGCSADPSLALLCLFICFPDSVNFSTRQLKKTPLPNNLVHKKNSFPTLRRLLLTVAV